LVKVPEIVNVDSAPEPSKEKVALLFMVVVPATVMLLELVSKVASEFKVKFPLKAFPAVKLPVRL